jgi:hypothetical protein
MHKKHHLSYYLWLFFLLIVLGFGIWVLVEGAATSWEPWFTRIAEPMIGKALKVMGG